MSETPTDTPTIYSAYEIDFMLSLRPTEAGETTRGQLGIHSAPPAAADHVRAAVASGLRARGKVELSEDGQWMLGEEAQIIAAALTAADRWLGMALTQGEAMRTAHVVTAGDAVLMLTQDELDTFLVSALEDRDQVPRTLADITRAFLDEGEGRAVSLRRVDAGSSKQELHRLMLHGDADGDLLLGHEPETAEGVLTVTPIDAQQLEGALTRLWADGISAAPDTSPAPGERND